MCRKSRGSWEAALPSAETGKRAGDARPRVGNSPLASPKCVGDGNETPGFRPT